jgi:hypothetical protein
MSTLGPGLEASVASGLAWLDSSREDQQRVRELLNLFRETESRDELGIGQVRDAFSDALFPGTSTLHTRARYLLIVPWCFRDTERRGLRGDALTARVERNERTVIGALLTAGDTDGMIGRVAKVAVKTLPSTIYNSALLRYGIRLGDDVHASLARRIAESTESSELVDRTVGGWHATLPPPPAGFPTQLDGGLDLSSREARWLRDRILTSLLAHLLQPPSRQLSADSAAAWEDPATVDAPADAASILQHARLFSVAIHGANLLYNLLIAERYEREELSRIDAPVARYRALLDGWVDQVRSQPDLTRWDRADMWSRVREENPRITANLMARRFIDRWLDAVTADELADLTDNDGLRRLVADREMTVKGSQSRLVNDTLLRTWSGASGSRPLNFRWTQVRRMLTDVLDGCSHEEEAVASATA